MAYCYQAIAVSVC